MEERKGFFASLFKMGTPLCGLAMGLLGVVLALMLLFLGIWKTLMVILFFAAGYFFGAYTNKAAAVKGFINRHFPPKGE